MENQLAKIVSESGAPADIQIVVNTALSEFFLKAQEWDATIKTIVITSPTDTGKMKMAREGRLFLRENRLKGEEIVKKNRDIVKEKKAAFDLEDKLWLRSGQAMVDTFKALESQLEEKEKFAEIFEANRKKELHKARVIELAQYEWQDHGLMDLGAMDDGSYAALLSGTASQYKERKEAERVAAEENLKQLKLQEIERSYRADAVKLGLVNYIDSYYNRKFCELTHADWQKVLDQAAKIKADYEAKQQALKESQTIAPPLTSNAPLNPSDKLRLLLYADAILQPTIPGFATKEGRAIYDEARGYLVKVAKLIRDKAAKL